MSADVDQLVSDYLRRLTSAASGLPDDRRNELLEEIAAHIAEARASTGGAGLDEAGMRDVLDRLGDPADIVQATGTAADHSGSRPASRRAGNLRHRADCRDRGADPDGDQAAAAGSPRGHPSR